MLLSTVSPNDVPTQGTVLAQAINLSKESFSQKEKKYKALIIISDGEDHDDEAVKAARDAADDGIIVHTVGIGSPQGTTITDPATGKIKLDDNGNPVITKLNEAELQDIARAGGGSYQLLGNANTIAGNLEQAITDMESHNMGSIAFTEYDSYYQYFIFAAFLLLIIDWLIPNASKIKIQPDNA
jgi:Ca-activated chloride channel family protein